MSSKVTRLFRQFVPNNYQLTLDIDDDNLTFKGKVVIKGEKVGRPSKRLTFHQKDLQITGAKALYSSKTGVKTVDIERINHHKKFEEVRLHSQKLLYPGEYLIELNFEGRITQTMHGIYPCNFKLDNQHKKLIATQFESHHAREAFPCIDEPEAKATFDLTLITKDKLVVLANTPIKKQSLNNKRLTSEFTTSPVMSCYLLAFVFGEMHSLSKKTKSGVIVSSWASLAHPLSALEYSVNEAVKILEFLEDYFKTAFPLKKLDHVALPDFEVGAMENWGLITYRESMFLSDKSNPSISTMQDITRVIAHETSHQWFGNLVTMRWWDNLWLNESFASLMENIVEEGIHRQWEPWEDFTAGRILACSHRDIYKDIQPVGVSVNHPDEISALFDPAIVYAKGARLLAMLLEVIGEDAFKEGLKNYFKEFGFSNATDDNLWACFSKASKQDIKQLMDPWIKQPGQPLVTMKRLGSRINLSQSRFLVDTQDQDQQIWSIPLLSQPPLNVRILDKSAISLDYPEKQKSPLLNASGNGHFISYYQDKESLVTLGQTIAKRSIDSSARIILLSDMLLLSRIGKYSLVDLLKIIAKLNQEDRDPVWSMILRTVAVAKTFVEGDETAEANLRKFKAKLSADWLKKLGWQTKSSDDINTQHLRITALGLSLSAEEPKVTKQALDLYDKTKDLNKLPSEQRALILATVVKRGQKADIISLKQAYEATANPDLKLAITSALCAIRDPKLAEQLVVWALSKEGAVKPQDYAYWFAYLMGNHYTRQVIWDWFISSWDRVAELSGGGKFMDYFVWYAASPLATRDWLKKYQQFFDDKIAEPGLRRNITISYSEIDSRVKWRDRDLASLKRYLADC